MRLALSILLCSSLAVVSSAHAQERPAPEPKASFYFLEGVTFSRVRGELGQRVDGLVNVQVGLGYQPAQSAWAYELFGSIGGPIGATGSFHGGAGWGIRGKRFHPLSRHLNLYGRVGVSENFLFTSGGQDLAGFGLEYGGGLQATLRVRALGFLFWPAFFLNYGPKADLSIWADLGGEIGNLYNYKGDGSEDYNYRKASGSYGVSIGGKF